MGKFDGILLASDWDGTLYYDGKLYEDNIKAIRYFQENGGKFTVCTGRYFEFLRQFSDDISVNTYMICYGGAYIVNDTDGEVLYESFCDNYLFKIIDKLLASGVKYESISFYNSESKEPVFYNIDEYFKIKNQLKNQNIYKALLRSDSVEHAEVGVKIANSLDLGDYIAVRSWNISLEILKKSNAKGAAIKRLASKLGSRLTVGVGDYENDIEMIKDADIGYAVANACDELKAVADRITVHAADSAIAKVIEDIEREFANDV